MKLQEIAETNNTFLDTEAEIIKWLNRGKIFHHEINDDLTVNVHGDIELSFVQEPYLPVQFNRIIEGTVYCNGSGLKSMKGFPYHVDHHFNIAWNRKMTSFEYAPKYIGKNCWTEQSTPNQISFHNIHKHFPEVHGEYFGVTPYSKNLLGLFFIKGLKSMTFGTGVEKTTGRVIHDREQRQIKKIINRNLSDGDIHSCQEELIQAGFIKEAKI